MATWEDTMKGGRWILGEGTQVSFWKDRWLP